MTAALLASEHSQSVVSKEAASELGCVSRPAMVQSHKWSLNVGALLADALSPPVGCPLTPSVALAISFARQSRLCLQPNTRRLTITKHRSTTHKPGCVQAEVKTRSKHLEAVAPKGEDKTGPHLGEPPPELKAGGAPKPNGASALSSQHK